LKEVLQPDILAIPIVKHDIKKQSLENMQQWCFVTKITNTMN